MEKKNTSLQNGLENLSEEALIALSRLVDKAKASAARDAIQPGVHVVDIFLVGQLHLEVRPDPKPRKPTCKIPTKAALALMLQRAGYTKKASMNLLIKVLKEAEALSKDKTKALMENVGLAEGLKLFEEIMEKSLKPIYARGATKVTTIGLIAQERRLTLSEAEILFPGEDVVQLNIEEDTVNEDD